MSGQDELNIMLQCSLIDLQALRNMLDKDRFHDAVFGFHAQQAIEKALKALIALHDVEYPFTHDLNLLFKMLEDLDENDILEYKALKYLTQFAVGFRYDVFLQCVLDRKSVLKQTTDLVNYVEGRVVQNK